MTTAELYAAIQRVIDFDAALAQYLGRLPGLIEGGLGLAAVLNDPGLQDQIDVLLATFPDLAVQAATFEAKFAYWQSVAAAIQPLLPEPPDSPVVP
jgi:hypothetical protein